MVIHPGTKHRSGYEQRHWQQTALRPFPAGSLALTAFIRPRGYGAVANEMLKALTAFMVRTSRFVPLVDLPVCQSVKEHSSTIT